MILYPSRHNQPFKKKTNKDVRKKSKRELQDEEELLGMIEQVKREMEVVHNLYNQATDQNIIDSYIYELKALHLKYDYLINQAKELCS